MRPPIYPIERRGPPPKIEAALQFLDYTLRARMGPSRLTCDAGDAPQDDRDLDREEVVTRKAALECLRLYFSGDMDFDAPPPSYGDEGPPMPPAPEPERV